ncbi:MAG: hypothetical protein CMA61_02345 [Euryarchaeota archaeon]|jgi:hypothetical protein|nr:hypothetical protein [Euryarchaeota archaeon]MBT92629.1 hypothetical protein [Euryarchaeota archaeon]|tara:strand:+ start:2531 stop:3265 length:735 start_codon:yes stop_codon:yes gene_type:complete
MSKRVHLIGGEDNFRAALVDKLENADAVIVDDSKKSDITVALGNEAEKVTADIMIIANNEQSKSGNSDYVPKAGLLIRIHDLMIPEGSEHWGPDSIEDWIESVRSGTVDALNPDIEARYWVNLRDATDAISLLVLADSDALAQGVVDLCGRRAWSPEAVLGEMRLLWQRFTNAIEQSHTVQSLSQIPSPAAIQFSGERRRPNLSPLHEAMKLAGREEGWRPITPMRVSLMELIAHSQLKSEQTE